MYNRLFTKGYALRLKKLKIHGFKSFADRVSLEFHQGITGIVGPNGCGKSNIADAFRWVLGETSAKSLRGKKMEDVIFAGTTSRKPINLAEASITLTDIQGFLPTEHDELEITRRYDRSGETEFLINGQTVRMRDVASLFLDSGLGKHAFSIFEQGNIDEIIQKSPKERRTIFEEAAGILRFFERRKEAERKLELSETNISRVRDICKEIEKQVSQLEAQAKEAESFQEKKGRLEQLERTLSMLRFHGLLNEREKLLQADSKKMAEILKIEELIMGTKDKISSLKVYLETKERTFQEMNEILFQARSEKEAKLRERESNSERLREFSQRLNAFIQQKESLEESQVKSVQLLEDLEKTIRETQGKESSQKAKLELEKAEFIKLEKTVLEEQQLESNLKEEKLHLSRMEKEVEGEVKETKARIESALEKKKKSETEKIAKKRAKEDFLQKQSAQKKLVSDLSLEVDDKKEVLDGYEKEESTLKAKSQILEKEVEELERNYVHTEARERSLIRLKEEMEGATPSFKKLMKECASEKSPLFGKLKPLFEVVKPKGEHKSLLAKLLSPYSETFVASDDESFSLALEFAEEISALSLNSLKELQGNTFEERVTSHFLKKAAQASSVQEAFDVIRSGKADFVFVDGAVVDAHLVYTKRKESGKNAFMRELEIEELKTSLQQLDKKRSEAIKALQIIKERKAESWQRKLESEKDLRRAEMRQLESNFVLQKLTSDLDAVTKDEAKFSAEEDGAKQELDKLESRLIVLQDLKLAKESALKEIESRGSDIFNRHEQSLIHFQNKKATLSALQKDVDELSFSLIRLEGELKVLNTKNQEYGREMKRLLAEIGHLHEWKDKCTVKSSRFDEALMSAEEVLSHSLKENKALEAHIREQKQALVEFEDSLKTSMASMDVLKIELTKIKIKEAEVDAGIKAESEAFEKQFGLQIATAQEEIPEAFNRIEAEKSVRSIRKEIEEMEGRINMMSIEELKKQSERRSYLQGQVDDMNLSKAEILELIATLDQESRILFEETFAKIRANFQKNFKVLFGEGGEADLEFIDSSDVLQAGIEIVAKPPGKKMRSINLLSGGEKCLTSMALLFSIFEIKPAPFCILDEIDAPLDDTNVERFLNVVKTFADRCQFIIITHNKRTMAIADRLFGVSMEERGVSKLLSMEFKPTEPLEQKLAFSL